MAQLAARRQAHPRRIQAWKKGLTEGATGVFGSAQEQKADSDAAPIARRYQEKRRPAPWNTGNSSWNDPPNLPV